MIHPRLTAPRRAWLQRLRDEKVANRHQNRVGFDTMQLGWTEWDYVGKADGEHYTLAEAKAKFDSSEGRYWDHVTIAGERLTPLGEAVLREYDER